MSDKIKCIVIDDEPIAREGISDYVKQIPFLELCHVFENAIDASHFLKENKVDLIFLDIEMPLLSGVDFIKTLSNPPKIIFTTAYSNYALQGFDLNATDYLLKPISFKRFLKAVNKVYESLSKSSNKNESTQDYFFIKTDKKFLKINFDQILYIESIKDYVMIYTNTEKHLVLLNMKNLMLQLPEKKFIRVHKSFLVSIDKINIIEGNMIKLKNTEIPIGREFKESVNDFLNNNLIKRSGLTGKNE